VSIVSPVFCFYYKGNPIESFGKERYCTWQFLPNRYQNQTMPFQPVKTKDKRILNYTMDLILQYNAAFIHQKYNAPQLVQEIASQFHCVSCDQHATDIVHVSLYTKLYDSSIKLCTNKLCLCYRCVNQTHAFDTTPWFIIMNQCPMNKKFNEYLIKCIKKEAELRINMHDITRPCLKIILFCLENEYCTECRYTHLMICSALSDQFHFSY